MTPRERRERAARNAKRGPICDGIGFVVILVIAALVVPVIGGLIVLALGALLLIVGLIVGLVIPDPNEDLPPA